MESREYQKAINYLCGLVKTGELAVGSKLPAERTLAQTLSIGRNSTREALRILESMGVIESRQGSGNYIVGDMARTISGMIEMMLLLRKITEEEVIVFRRDVEKVICNLIITNGSMERWYDQIKEVLESEMEVQRLEEQIEADQNFHFMLISAAENRLWIGMSEAITDIYQDWIKRVLMNADYDTKCRLHQCHKELLLALKKGAKEEAEKAVDHHYDLVDMELRKERNDHGRL